MTKVNVYNLEGKVVGEQELAGKFWDTKENAGLLHQVIVSMEGNARHSYAHTKNRGEVRGGGKKPWKQKGTGRARHGSSRSPVWVGGGITFGPRKERDYSRKINKTMARAATTMLLANKAQNDRLIVVDSFAMTNPKTKMMDKILNNLPSGHKKTFIALPKSDKAINRSAANLPYVWVSEISNLNPRDLIRYSFLLTTVEGLKKIEVKFDVKKK